MGHCGGGGIGIERIEAWISRGGFLQASDHTFDNVIDVGEVPLHLALVEHLDGLPSEDRLSEQDWSHVRPSPRAVDREKAQARGRQAIEMAVGMGHQLIGLFGCCVEAHRVVDRVLLRKRHLPVAAIHRAAGGIDQVLDALVPASFKNIPEAIQVALDVGRRVFDGVAHPSLGGQMNDGLWFLSFK